MTKHVMRLSTGGRGDPLRAADALPFPEPVDEEAPGRRVGRLIIEDLAAVYLRAAGRPDAPPPMSAAKKAELVDGLVNPEDVADFNDYRYVHEYLAKASISFTLHQQFAQTAFWKICFILSSLRYAQLAVRAQAPLPLFPEAPAEPAAAPGRNIFGDMGDNLEELLEDYLSARREAWVIRTTVELMGELVEVPDLGAILTNTKDDLSELKLMVQEAQAELAEPYPPLEAVADKLRSLTPAKLRPRPAAVKQARQRLSFKVVQGHVEDFYRLLRGGRGSGK